MTGTDAMVLHGAVLMPIRWRVAVLVSAAIAISYLDRQALPVAVKAIEADIPLTNTQFGELTSSPALSARRRGLACRGRAC